MSFQAPFRVVTLRSAKRTSGDGHVKIEAGGCRPFTRSWDGGLSQPQFAVPSVLQKSERQGWATRKKVQRGIFGSDNLDGLIT